MNCLRCLEKQRHQQAEIDRILKIVLPILAFLLCVICAKLNNWLELAPWERSSFWMAAFFAVRTIKRMNLYFWLAIYCRVLFN